MGSYLLYHTLIVQVADWSSRLPEFRYKTKSFDTGSTCNQNVSVYVLQDFGISNALVTYIPCQVSSSSEFDDAG